MTQTYTVTVVYTAEIPVEVTADSIEAAQYEALRAVGGDQIAVRYDRVGTPTHHGYVPQRTQVAGRDVEMALTTWYTRPTT